MNMEWVAAFREVTQAAAKQVFLTKDALSLFYKPVPVLWHGNFEPGTFPGKAVLGDGNSGYRQDFTGKKQAKAGLLPKTPFKQMFLICGADSGTIILNSDHKSRVIPSDDTVIVFSWFPPYLSALSIRL